MEPKLDDVFDSLLLELPTDLVSAEKYRDKRTLIVCV